MTVSEEGNAAYLMDEFNVAQDHWEIDRDEALLLFSQMCEN
jgi:hypothetical protein